MARTGILYTDVQKAAFELQGFGKVPTIDGIREILGTGSRTTIANHLKQWRSEQVDGTDALPQELVAMVSGLWKKLQAQSKAHIEKVESECSEKNSAQIQTIANLKKEIARLEHKLHLAEEKSANEALTKNRLEEDGVKLTQENIKLKERYDAAIKKIDDLKSDNDRLHQLAKNIQLNFEHYQEQIQKSQLEKSLQTDKRQQAYQAEIVALKQQLSHQSSQFIPLKDENEKIKTELLALNNKYDSLLKEHNNNQSMLNELETQKAMLLERNYQAQNSINALKEDLNALKPTLLKTQTELAIINDQNTNLRREIAKANDKVSILRDEKLFIAQEKANLEGYLSSIKEHSTAC